MRMFAFVILALLLFSGALFPQTPDASLHQVNGKITLGPVELSPPKGYWYYPSRSRMGSGSFLTTFFETARDATMEESPESAENPVINVFVFANRLEGSNSYGRANLHQGADKKTRVKELPPNIKTLFAGVSDWRCNEVVTVGYRNQFVLNCVSLNHYSVAITAIGFDEGKVLGMAPRLRSMIDSAKTTTAEEPGK